MAPVKLFEELFHPGETLVQTAHEKLLLAHSREMDWVSFESAMEEFESRCSDYDEAAIRQLLDDLLPEYSPSAVIEPRSNVIPLDKAKG